MYTFDGRIRYSETDSAGRLTLTALIDYFQDCSTFHSEDAGLGIAYLRQRSLVWVLCSWQIVVERRPAFGEYVTVGTQPYDMKGCFGYRNFWMRDEKGVYTAKANTLWTLLDMESARPVAVPKQMAQAYQLGEKLDMEYAPRKIAIPGEGEKHSPVAVKKHHLDTNHHVNNGQFVDMAMDFLPEGYQVRQLRAEYKKQAFLDDILYPCVAKERDRVVVALADQAGAPYAVVEFEKRGIF